MPPPSNSFVHDETRAVVYKQTARWNVREERRDNTMEQVIVKTVAGMLNDRGGTLLIGVTDGGEPVGLDDDYNQVKPPNADGYVNSLDTLFENNLGHSGANRLTYPHRPDRRPRRLPHRRASQLTPHLGQEQQWPRHPLPAPQQLYEARAVQRRLRRFVAERFGSQHTS